MSTILTQQALQERLGAWLAAGRRVAAPVRVKPDRVLYAPVREASAVVLDGYIRPANSIKEFLFPRHEELYGYRRHGKQIELVATADQPLPPQIVFGARPCDAAALPILDHVFRWDSKDALYERRRAALTVVTIACTQCDASCFCTSVGLSPAAERGSDALLLPLGDGRYELRALTDRGRALFEGAGQPADATAPAFAGPPVRFAPPAIRAWLEQNFESPVWQGLAARCLGCGVCSFTCPTCHCFDIVDEGNSCGGCRARNWDGCQFAMFTLHASGHNPRANQAQRQRQRIQHKFRIYPEKFGDLLCTGCGNCTRGCPGGLGMSGSLAALPLGAAEPAKAGT